MAMVLGSHYDWYYRMHGVFCFFSKSILVINPKRSNEMTRYVRITENSVIDIDKLDLRMADQYLSLLSLNDRLAD